MMRALTLTAGLALALCLAPLIHADETKGTIKSIDTGRREVILKGLVKDSTYELTKGASVWLDGARCKLGDLAPNDRAVVQYQSQGEHMMADMVRGLRKAQETTGTVKDVSPDRREVTLKGVLKNTTYELTKAGTVWVDGKQTSLPSVLPGDEVVVTYEEQSNHWIATDVTVLKHQK